jgi:hypothetical protein
MTLAKKLVGFVPDAVVQSCVAFAGRLLDRPLSNVFGSLHPRAALISYLAAPFRRKPGLGHTNAVEVLEIGRVFHDLGFRVDVVHYEYKGKIDYDKYDILLGFGDPLIRSYQFRKKEIRTVYYGTGMHVLHQNSASLRRVEELHRKRGCWVLESARVVEKAYSVQTSLVNAMVVLGNEKVADSYRSQYHGRIYSLPPSFFSVIDAWKLLSQKQIGEASKNFCWFGGRGCVHKGLDLLLDFFRENSGLHLHVCGPIDGEPRFKECFHEELYRTRNIHTHGFVRLDSSLFREVMARCAFVVFPSCSEGAPSSVLNVMGNGGLIPILTPETGIDIEDFGVTIPNPSQEDVREAILQASAMPSSEIRRRSEATIEFTGSRHSLVSYANNLRVALTDIIEGLP